MERQHGSWVWCVWCGERLCHGAVGAQQCAGLCSLGKPCMAEGYKQRLGFTIIGMLYHPEKQLWHSHFMHRLCGCGWGMDPRKEGCLTILTHPHSQTRPAAHGRWLGAVELGAHDIHINSNFHGSPDTFTFHTVPAQGPCAPANTSYCSQELYLPPTSSMLAPISLFNFYPEELSLDPSFGFVVPLFV